VYDVELLPADVSLTDRLRFLKAYLREHTASVPEWKDLWRTLARAYARRIAREKTWPVSVYVDTQQVTWECRPGLVQEFYGAEGLRLEQWRREGRVDVVKTGPHRTVYRLRLDSG